MFVFLLQTLLFCGGSFVILFASIISMFQSPRGPKNICKTQAVSILSGNSHECDFTANLLLIEKILNEVQPKVYISVPFESTYLYDDNCWICKYSESRRLI